MVMVVRLKTGRRCRGENRSIRPSHTLPLLRSNPIDSLDLSRILLGHWVKLFLRVFFLNVWKLDFTSAALRRCSDRGRSYKATSVRL